MNNLNGATYVIQWGDTLSGISAATGISVRKLAYDNGIRNIDLIYAGDTLILNRNGYVPSDWNYDGDGNRVANTKITINNFVDNSDNSVTINVSPVTNNGDSGQSGNASSSSSDEYKAKDSSGQVVGDSDDSNSNTSNDSDTTKSANTLDDDEFDDAVSAKLADKLGLADDDSDKLSVDFTDPESDEDSDSTTDTDSDADTDSDTQTVYDEDQTVSTGSVKLTEKNANKLAKKIYKQLKADDKLSDLTDADEIEVTVTTDGDDFSYNVTLTSESTDDDSSADSESDTQDEDSEDSEDNESTDQSSSADSDQDVATTSDEDTESDY